MPFKAPINSCEIGARSTSQFSSEKNISFMSYPKFHVSFLKKPLWRYFLCKSVCHSLGKSQWSHRYAIRNRPKSAILAVTGKKGYRVGRDRCVGMLERSVRLRSRVLFSLSVHRSSEPPFSGVMILGENV